MIDGKLPLVGNSYITVEGKIKDIIRFVKDAVPLGKKEGET